MKTTTDTTVRKLSLRKATIRVLGTQELAGVVGGGTSKCAFPPDPC